MRNPEHIDSPLRKRWQALDDQRRGVWILVGVLLAELLVDTFFWDAVAWAVAVANVIALLLGTMWAGRLFTEASDEGEEFGRGCALTAGLLFAVAAIAAGLRDQLHLPVAFWWRWLGMHFGW
jgi:hypothetical protein